MLEISPRTSKRMTGAWCDTFGGRQLPGCVRDPVSSVPPRDPATVSLYQPLKLSNSNNATATAVGQVKSNIVTLRNTAVRQGANSFRYSGTTPAVVDAC